MKGTNAAYATPTYFEYEKNGSLNKLVEPSGTSFFAYNSAGLVARIKWRDASATYFFYDGGLQRYAILVGGTLNYFLWDGLDILQELNSDGTVKEERSHAKTPIAGIGQLVESYRPAEAAADQKIYPIQDPRGTITKWLKSDGTTVLASREYDAFGRIIASSGTWPGRLGYQGQAWIEIASADAAQRMLLSPTRIYDATDGKFTQIDAAPNTRASSQYAYAGASPLNRIDALGMQDSALEAWQHSEQAYEKGDAQLHDLYTKLMVWEERKDDLFNEKGQSRYRGPQGQKAWAMVQALKKQIQGVKDARKAAGKTIWKCEGGMYFEAGFGVGGKTAQLLYRRGNERLRITVMGPDLGGYAQLGGGFSNDFPDIETVTLDPVSELRGKDFQYHFTTAETGGKVGIVGLQVHVGKVEIAPLESSGGFALIGGSVGLIGFRFGLDLGIFSEPPYVVKPSGGLDKFEVGCGGKFALVHGGWLTIKDVRREKVVDLGAGHNTGAPGAERVGPDYVVDPEHTRRSPRR